MSSRRRGRLGRRLAVGTLALVVVGGGAGAYRLTTGDDAPTTQPLATTRAVRATLTQTVDASFTLVDSDAKKLQAPSGGTVTSVSLTEGKGVKALAALASIDGKSIYGIPSDYPLYRDLAEGDDGKDVKALQQALAGAGYDPGDVDGEFGSSTADALSEWQADHDLDETGQLQLASFVSYPPGSIVDEVSVEVGDRIAGGGQIATWISRTGLAAQADVSQLDVDDLKLGQQVDLTFDGLSSATAKGTVDDIAKAAESSDSSAGTSTVVEYAVTVNVSKLPSGAKAGMTGQASVVAAKRSNVVVVPSSAIGGSGSDTTVQVVSGGATVTRQVVVGLVTTEGTEILTGVKAGEEVVTGLTASNTGAANQTQQQPGGGFPGGGGLLGGGGAAGGGRSAGGGSAGAGGGAGAGAGGNP